MERGSSHPPLEARSVVTSGERHEPNREYAERDAPGKVSRTPSRRVSRKREPTDGRKRSPVLGTFVLGGPKDGIARGRRHTRSRRDIAEVGT